MILITTAIKNVWLAKRHSIFVLNASKRTSIKMWLAKNVIKPITLINLLVWNAQSPSKAANNVNRLMRVQPLSVINVQITLTSKINNVWLVKKHSIFVLNASKRTSSKMWLAKNVIQLITLINLLVWNAQSLSKNVNNVNRLMRVQPLSVINVQITFSSTMKRVWLVHRLFQIVNCVISKSLFLCQ